MGLVSIKIKSINLSLFITKPDFKKKVLSIYRK